MDKPTNEGERLIKHWLSSKESLDRSRRYLSLAECELRNSINNLGKWMVPADVKPGEKICVWYGDSLIQVEVKEKTHQDGGDYIITVRKRGKALL